MKKLEGINAVSLSAETQLLDPKIWEKVDRGEYNPVYTTLEVCMDTWGHFSTQTLRARPPTAFMANLVTVAIDECYLIWDWEGFRSEYGYIEGLRLGLNRITFVCLSATLMKNMASYVHETCKLEVPICQIWL